MSKGHRAVKYFDIIGNMKIKDASEALAAIAHPRRLEIFRLLVQAGPEGLAAGEIAHRLELPPATLSFHIKELSRAEMVAARSQGRHIIYSAGFGRMAELVAYLTQDCCNGNPEVCAPLSIQIPLHRLSADPKSHTTKDKS